jgi:hypothetical protein
VKKFFGLSVFLQRTHERAKPESGGMPPQARLSSADVKECGSQRAIC